MTVVIRQRSLLAYEARMVEQDGGADMLCYEPDDARIRFWPDETEPGHWHLDVRELLADGGEPYAAIMECLHQLGAGQRLSVHALMQPHPLLRQLGRMGYTVAAEHLGPDHWRVDVGVR